MGSFGMDVLADLVVAVIAAAAAYIFRGKTYKRRVEAAPKIYLDHLGKLIAAGINEGPGRAPVNAKAIVATRNDLRSSLTTVAKLLNSEIDELQAMIGEDFKILDEITRKGQGQADDKRLFQVIEVLHKKWPAKRDQIEVEIRKLISELGLDRA